MNHIVTVTMVTETVQDGVGISVYGSRTSTIPIIEETVRPIATARGHGVLDETFFCWKQRVDVKLSSDIFDAFSLTTGEVCLEGVEGIICIVGEVGGIASLTLWVNLDLSVKFPDHVASPLGSGLEVFEGHRVMSPLHNVFRCHSSSRSSFHFSC